VIFTYIAYQIKQTIPENNTLFTTLWIMNYSLIQGTIWFGLWILAHECGHGAFAKSKIVNDAFGLILHSFLLVPYFSWQYSHKKHHKYTNHITLGETHLPFLKTELPSEKYKSIRNKLGPFLNTTMNTIPKLTVGWPFYLFCNSSGGRLDVNNEIIPNNILDFFTYSHMNPYSKIFPSKMKYKVFISDIFLILQLASLYYLDHIYGFGTSLIWYWPAYLVNNAWLVVYTILQHTDKDVPHHGQDTFTWLKGALSTIDRNYPYLVDEMHHYIGTTHVLHHINHKIPFYYAKQATKELKIVLGELYNYDNRNFLMSFYNTMLTCNYIEALTGTQYYKQLDLFTE